MNGGFDNGMFFAGGGADPYHGGSGEDILPYQNSETGLTIDVHDGSNGTGIAGGDTVTSVERLFGSKLDDNFQADDGMHIRGLDSDDILYDADGKEHMIGGDGSDQFSLGSDGNEDRVDDFQIGEDILDLSTWRGGSFDQLSFFVGWKRRTHLAGVW